MDNEQENEKHEKSKPSKEEIPSWLQGLDNSEPENDSPPSSNDDVADSWVREINDKPDYELTQDSLEAVTNDDEIEKPDWLNQLSKVDSGTPAILRKDTEEPTFKAPIGNEATKKTEINDDLIEKNEFDNASANKFSPDSIESIEDMNTEEAFVELSKFDLEENPESLQPTLNEPFENEDELPDWLQEMIAEPSEIVSEISQPDFEETIEQDEDHGDSMDITQETDVAVNNILETSPTLDMVNTADSDEDAIESIEDDELIIESNNELTIESSDGLINESSDEDNTLSIEKDEFMFENLTQSHENGMSKILRFGKYLLDQKDFEPAIEIFSNYVSKSEHLEEIHTWLSDITFDEAETNSSVWELIGDIALIKAEPNQALTAYTQAIKTLLHAQE